ncbi:MAG: hypothetical protein QOC61_456 [Acidobacteriota bacterium]|jgi:hypothetical protein|nr:hypothetical protein [Acidobacteriota bacterium]MDT5261452.1 hypothetical protein [Acidobacteriota bacterium]MDT7778986.1 hypothetical protein [Acidobacteriota bacterium]
MLKLILACVLLCGVSAVASTSPGQGNKAERLRDVTSVYVIEAGQTEKAKALRQEIIRKLGESGRVRVVDAPGAADAVLSLSIKQVTKNVDWGYSELGDDSTVKTGTRVVPAAQIMFRLDSQRRQSLWTAGFDPENFRGKDERQTARAIGKRAGQDLLKAIERDSRRHQ